MTGNTAGALWALSAAVLAAYTNVISTSPVRRLGVLAATCITNGVNILILGVIGWWLYRAEQFSWAGMLWFALLGVTAYSYGRFVFYQGLSAIGPSRQMTLMSLAPFLSLFLGVMFLGEEPRLPVVFGTFLVAGGVVFVSYEPTEGGSWYHKGIIWGFLSAISVGVSFFIRKKGLAAMPNVALTVAWANFVSFPIILSLRPLVPSAYFVISDRAAIRVMLIAGAFNAASQILMNYAVFLGDISVVTPIYTSAPIFSLIFAALFGRGIERTRWTLVVGVLLTFAGMIAIGLGRG